MQPWTEGHYMKNVIDHIIWDKHFPWGYIGRIQGEPTVRATSFKSGQSWGL